MGVAVAAITGDSSPSSAESSFRELDDVFLQTQTRIWLGEVLHTRLGEQLHISDILADGELLFEVSKVIWKMLLAKYVELRHVKLYKCEPFASRKSSGRYMPYSNVDSFLKICKILGLNGIDLFSPSDVVEKRNIRKVCMCIRSLSKKARLKDLKVPDFDIVTYTIAMPTDMVGCIRKSLERSQFSLSSYVSHSHEIGSRSKFRQKKLVAADDQTYDSCSEGSDEAESNYMEVRLYSPSTSEPYCTSETNLGIENPLGMSSEVEKYTLSQSISLSDIQNLDSNVDEQSSTESVGSICSKYVKNDYQIDSMFSPCFDSKMKLVAEAPHTNYEGRYTSENSAQKLFDLDFGPKNDACFLGDHLDDNTSEICTSHQSTCSDFIGSGTGKNDVELFNGEDSMFEVYMDTASHCSSSTKDNQYGLGRRIFLDIEDVEVSSNTSKSSLSGQMLNSNSCDENHVDSSKTGLHQTYSSVVVADNDEEVGTNMVDSDPVTNKSPNINLSAACSTNRIDVCEDLHSSCNSPAVGGSGRRYSQNQSMVVQDMSGQCADTQQITGESAAINNMCVVTPEMRSHSTSGISNNGGNGHEACEEYNDDIYIAGCIRKMTIMDEEKLENVGILAEETLDGREDRNGEIPEGKPAKKLLLKRVVKGTAIVGVLFLLLQLRNRNGKRETGEVSSPSSQIHKSEDAEFSSRKECSGAGGNGTYPAEKLKFGF